jgi:hypothetical protein
VQVASGPLLPRYGSHVEAIPDSTTAPSDSGAVATTANSSIASSFLASIQARGGKPSGPSPAPAAAASESVQLPPLSNSSNVRLLVKAPSSKELTLCGRRGGFSIVSDAFSGRFACALVESRISCRIMRYFYQEAPARRVSYAAFLFIFLAQTRACGHRRGLRASCAPALTAVQ